jgi:hypothetical protein
MLLELWDSSGSKLLATGSDVLNAAGQIIGEQLSLPAVSGEAYLVHVGGVPFDSLNSVPYALVLQSLTADLGTQVHGFQSGSIPTGGQAIYRLAAAVTGTLRVRMTTGANFQGKADLQLLSADGLTVLASGPLLVIGNGNSGSGQAVEVSIPVTQGQAVLLQLGGGINVQNDFTLEFTNLDQFEEAQPLQGLLDGTTPGGSRVVYQLTVPQTGTLQAQVTAGADFQGSLNFQVFNVVNGTPVARLAIGQDSSPPGPGQVSQASFSVTQGQTLWFRIAGGTNPENSFELNYLIQQPATLFFPTLGTPSALKAVDLNHDGNLDLVAATPNLDNAINVLLGAGDGTFQAARGYDAGSGGLRDLAVADLTGSGNQDVIVSNFGSADVSALLGRGDGTFQPARRSNSIPQGDAIATGDFNGDGIPDLAVVQRISRGGPEQVAILIGRGDGTFEPPQFLTTSFTEGAFPVLVGDLNNDGKQDLVVFSFNDPGIDIFMGNGDGTFGPPQLIQTVEATAAAQLADLNGDGKFDIITTGTTDGIVSVLMNNGDGTFQSPETFQAVSNLAGRAIAITGLVVGDFGSPSGFGMPDGHPDLVVTAAPRNSTDLPQVLFLPGLFDSQGHFTGFGMPEPLAVGPFVGPLAAGDFAGTGTLDVAAATSGGIEVIYGQPPHLVPNNTPQTARNLGTVLHLVSPMQTIVPDQTDAFFTFTVPTEAIQNAGNEVVDFSGLFQDTGGAGLSMDVHDAAGNLLGSGARFRLVVAQGEVLTLHVFGLPQTDGTLGTGAYTLVIDVLPQVVSVVSQHLLPGVSGHAGGPTTSLIITLQGDRLDPATAENPANYQIFFMGPTGTENGPTGQLIPIESDTGQSITYNPDAIITVASGLTFPNEVRQTITFVFGDALPAGEYRIVLSSGIQTEAFNSAEVSLLADNAGFAGHPVVSIVDGNVTNGSETDAPRLVLPVSALGDLNVYDSGTPYLTNLHGDIGRILDENLTHQVDTATITKLISQQLAAACGPGLGTPGNRPVEMMIIWLDPVSIDVADPQGKHATYDLKTNKVNNQLPGTYMEVGGNVELLVLADIAGSFKLSVSDVLPSARGGAILLTETGESLISLTDSLQSGLESFVFDVPPIAPSTTPSGPPQTPGSEGGGPASETTVASNLTSSLISLLVTASTSTIAPSSNSGVNANASLLLSSLTSGLPGLGTAGAFGTLESGGNTVPWILEQVIREITDRVGQRLNLLAGEVGSRGSLLVDSSLKLLESSAQALLPALNSLGLELPLPEMPLGQIGKEVLDAILPSVKAIGDAVRMPANGKKNGAAPPLGQSQNQVPPSEPQVLTSAPQVPAPQPPAPAIDTAVQVPDQDQAEQELHLIPERSEPELLPSKAPAEHADLMLAAALLVAGVGQARGQNPERTEDTSRVKWSRQE